MKKRHTCDNSFFICLMGTGVGKFKMVNNDNFSFGQGPSGTSQQPPVKPIRQTKFPELTGISKSLSEIASSLRILEDKYYNLRKKSQLTDQNLLDAQRTFAKEKRLLTDELTESKLKIQDLLEQFDNMKTELKSAVRQKDYKVLEKYLDMWEPMEFVTRKEVEMVIERKFPDKNKINDSDLE